MVRDAFDVAMLFAYLYIVAFLCGVIQAPAWLG